MTTVRRLAVTAAWVLATVLAALAAWWAVGAVGSSSRDDGAGVLSGDQVAQALAAERAAGGTDAPAGSPTPTSDGTADPGSTPTSGPTTRPTVDPSAEPTGPTGPTPAPADVVRTWQVTGGVVSAVCRGTGIDLLYATPVDGWTVEVKHAGPEEVEVELAAGESETKVRATCVDGVPTPATESDD